MSYNNPIDFELNGQSEPQYKHFGLTEEEYQSSGILARGCKTEAEKQALFEKIERKKKEEEHRRELHRQRLAGAKRQDAKAIGKSSGYIRPAQRPDDRGETRSPEVRPAAAGLSKPGGRDDFEEQRDPQARAPGRAGPGDGYSRNDYAAGGVPSSQVQRSVRY